MSVKRFALLTLAAMASAAAMDANSIPSIVVFGDSLSDNGNLYAATGIPGSPYYMGRRSNGPVAVEQLASSLGATLYDFAWIGATTGIGNYADGGTPTTLGFASLPGMQLEYLSTAASLGPLNGGWFVVWGGPNDFLSPSPLDTTVPEEITRASNDVTGIVNALQAEGAKNILVPGMPDLGLTPYFESLGPAAAAQGSAITDAFNSLLFASLPSGVTFFDTAALMRSIVNNPALYGFTDVTDPCFDGVTVCSNPDQYVFFDDFHPTTAADGVLAQGFERAVTPEPHLVLLLSVGLLALVLVHLRNSRRKPL